MILDSESVWIAPSFSLHEAAHGVHGRASRKIDAELALDRCAELGSQQFVDQPAEMAADIELGRGMRAGAGHFRIVGENGEKSPPLRKSGTTTKSKGSRSSGVRSSAAKSQYFISRSEAAPAMRSALLFASL